VFDFILNPLEIAVSWILVQFHTLFTPLFGAASGTSWALSIVGLVLVIRTILIPLFVKQIRAQRNMQLIQPQMKEIQTKYAGDRERQSQEMMKLYQETGTNPFSSCLPILAQAPIFFALFTVLQGIAQTFPEGVFQWDEYAPLLDLAHNAKIFGVPIYGTFMNADETPDPGATRVLAMILVVLMTASTFITQRQLIVKNVAADNPMVQQQKILLYVFPFLFAVGGVGFPIGVLLYWLTTNVWSMGQQFWVIRNSPSPGTPAHEAYLARKAAKAAKKGIVEDSDQPDSGTTMEAPRTQPKRQPRSKRKK
jgi:YidC/Oxa1 family membrane protein insertase